MISKTSAIIWVVVTMAVVIPLALAARSPLLEWREPVYIVAGLAGVFAMTLLLVQPLLAMGQLPGINRVVGTRVHRVVGTVLLVSIMVHVGGLWITSPPDVIDALLFRSATSFSVWGVIGLWGVFLTSVLVALRKRLSLQPGTWKMAHKLLAVVIVLSTVVHAVLIEGTMESVSKYALCALLLLVIFVALFKGYSGKI